MRMGNQDKICVKSRGVSFHLKTFGEIAKGSTVHVLTYSRPL